MSANTVTKVGHIHLHSNYIFMIYGSKADRFKKSALVSTNIIFMVPGNYLVPVKPGKTCPVETLFMNYFTDVKLN